MIASVRPGVGLDSLYDPRIGVLLEQTVGIHDHSWRAVPALVRAPFEELLLQWV